jgi:small subunit ribosomal protein S17
MADTEKAEIGNKNEKMGSVVGTTMAKTIIVQVTRRVAHPVYKRIVSKRKKFYAHDEKEEAKVGDVVRIIECRPMSKLKRWSLGEILRKAVQVQTDLSSIGIGAKREALVSKKKQVTKKKKGKR